MAKAPRAAERRDDALSRERIVDAAIALLDEAGEAGLTFRALATRLATGSGAIYWHIASKSELLVATSDAVVARAMGDAIVFATPLEAIRGIAAGVFDTVDAHPWVGAQLSRVPRETATMQIFERVGRQLQALKVPTNAQLTSASTLLSYIIGVSVENSAQGRVLDPPVDRAEFLAKEAARWKVLDVRAYPFTRTVAAQLRDHDDREEFLGGIDLILSGVVATLRRPV